MSGPIIPEEVKSRMADARAKLVKVISKWELSGNGFGQCHQTENGDLDILMNSTFMQEITVQVSWKLQGAHPAHVVSLRHS